MGPNKKNAVLITDDDRSFCESVKDYLSSDTIEVLTAHSAKECLDICSQKNIDVVLLDQRLPDKEGHTLCPDILNYNDQTKIIFSTAYPNFENAVRAIRAGAFDYLSKPYELEELRLAVTRALRTTDLERVEQFQNYEKDKEKEKTIVVGSSKEIAEVKRLVNLAAYADAPVLITGETGTGKNVVARSIHYCGTDKKTPFISVNCAAIPENLIEAELFGYEKGAFTGAISAKKGLFEMADGGTLFLNEIGEMPVHFQAKLLDVLDDKQIKRLGSESIRHVTVRVIAATSINLENAIREKTFREDLYFRLSVIKIIIPPLRKRKEDIPELCDFFIKGFSKGHPIKLSDSEKEKLIGYDWPGNVRELKNILERAIILQKGNIIMPSKLLSKEIDMDSQKSSEMQIELNGPATLHDLEKRLIKHALNKSSGNYTKAATTVGISFSTLKRKIKKYGLE